MPIGGGDNPTVGRRSPIFRVDEANTETLLTIDGAGKLASAATNTTGAWTVNGAETVTGTSTKAPGWFASGTAHPASSSLNAHIATATVAGNDTRGTITFVTDATGVTQNGVLATITFANATLYTATPVILLQNVTAGADSTTLFSGTFGVVAASATTFQVVNLGHALTASGTFVCDYVVIG